MRPPEILSRLGGLTGRGPGTDAERRAAQWLASELRQAGRDVTIETFWCRPNWALAHAWHVAAALAGSLMSVVSPTAGVATLAVVLLSTIVDAAFAISLGRSLTPERASQNVVASAPADRTRIPAPSRLIITANYDAGRMGLAYRKPLRTTAAALKRLTGGVTPGWLGWLCIAIAWVLVVAVVRLEGHTGQAIGAVQFPPTVALVLAFALLVDIATADFGPAAGDNGSGVAAAIALARVLDVAPPGNLAVELVLEGAGEGGRIGLRRHLRARRAELKAPSTIVLGVAACAGGTPRWWTSDGALVPLRYARPLVRLCQTTAAKAPRLAAAGYAGRGAAPALPARQARLPAITIGCLDEHGLAPRSHQRSDTPTALDTAAVDQAVEFALILIDAIDGYLAQSNRTRAVTPA